MKSFRLQGSL